MDYKNQFIKKIKKYYLCKELEKNLFLSYDEQNNKICMIKIISRNLEEKEILYLKRDIQELIKIKNANLINLISYEATNNNIYLIYEYCNGGNLRNFIDFIKKNNDINLNTNLIQNIILQIITGLESLHKINKPLGYLSLENIYINFDKNENTAFNGLINEKIALKKELLDEPFTIKINYFIYKKDKDEIIKNINVIKSIAPEIVKFLQDENNKNKDLNIERESDLWSLGTISYELLFGKSAFNGDNIKEIIDKIIIGKYSIPNKFISSIDIISFINGLLQYYPKNRPNLETIKVHNFLKKKPEEFFQLNDFDKGIIDDLEINSKYCENIIWGLLALQKSNKNSNITNIQPIQNIEESEEKEESGENIINEENINENDNNEIIEKTEDLNINEKKEIEEEKGNKEKENKNNSEEDEKIEKINLQKKIDKDKKNNDFENQFEIIDKYEDIKIKNKKQDNKKTKLGESSYIEI